MRYSTWLAIVVVLGGLLGGLEYRHYRQKLKQAEQALILRRQFQKAVALPDLAITTAARYLRHYSLADLATPFQDYPAGLDHFPAGFAFEPPDFAGMPSVLTFGATAQPKG